MLKITDHGRVREIQLDRPPANAINPQLISSLTDQLNQAAEEMDAVVISGRPGMFSAGLDIPELLQLDRDGISVFWQSFTDLLNTIAHMPVPTAFALTGHAPAGGIVLSLFGDYTIMCDGKYKTGLNEVQVGLVVSSVIKNGLIRRIGPHPAEKILVPGSIISAQHAFELGLVDELAEDPEAAVSKAIAWCENLLKLPASAMSMTRQLTRKDLQGFFDNPDHFGVETFTDLWFSDTTQNTLKSLVERLQKK
jgi:3,2-trans-enoyl-CoA isomerase